MSYLSGEIKVPIRGMRPWAGSACLSTSSDGTSSLWFVYEDLQRLTCASVPLADIALGGLAGQNWTATGVALDGQPTAQPKTRSGCGLTARPAPLLVWHDGGSDGSAVWAAEYGSGKDVATWGTLTRLCAAAKGSPHLSALDFAAVDATALGEDYVVVACSAIDGYGLYVGIFAAAQRQATWTAVHDYGWDVATFTGVMSGVISTGRSVSIDWFVTTDPASTATSPLPPACYLAVAIAVEAQESYAPVVAYLRLRFDNDGVPYIDQTQDPVIWESHVGEAPITIARDPAGRLRTYQTSNGLLTVVTHGTLVAPVRNADGPALPVVLTEWLSAPSGGGQPAVVGFTESSTYGTTVMATAIDGSVKPFTCNQADGWEIIVYGDGLDLPGCVQPTTDGPITVQARSFGYAQAIDSLADLQLDPDEPGGPPPPAYVVVGIVDGPFPLCNAQLTFTDDQGDIVYSGTKDSKVGHDVSSQRTVGIKFEAHPATSWGAVVDASFSRTSGQTASYLTSSSDGTAAVFAWPSITQTEGGLAMPAIGSALVAAPQVAYRSTRWVASFGAVVLGTPGFEPATDSSRRVYGRAEDGSLLAFVGVDGLWSVTDVSAALDASPPVVLGGDPAGLAGGSATAGQGVAYACRSDGHLLRIAQDGTAWTYHDVTSSTSDPSPALTGRPCPVVVDGREFVVAVSVTGHVLMLWPVDDVTGTWSFTDVSATQGSHPFTAATEPPPTVSFVTVGDGSGSAAASIVFTGSSGHGVLLWTPDYLRIDEWTHDDYSQRQSPVVPVTGSTVQSQPVPVGGATYAVATKTSATAAGDLVRWYADDRGNHFEDVSSSLGNIGGAWTTVAGNPATCSSPIGAAVALRRVDGHLLVLTGSGSGDPWSVADLTMNAAEGTFIASDPAFAAPGVVYAVATDGHLLEFATADGQAGGAWTVTDVSVACGSNGTDESAVIHDATNPAAGQALGWAVVTPTITPAETPMDYPLYGPTAGDLTSYTAYSWTQRMKALAEQNPHDDLYAGDDYLGQVVEPLAYPLVSDGKAMTNTWGGGNTDGVTNQQSVSTSIVETSWSIDASFYAGIGFSGVNDPTKALTGFLGVIGMNEAFSAMAGGSLQTTHTTSTTNDTGWGVAITGPDFTGTWGPKKKDPLPVGGVSSYAFGIYLLPPPDAASGRPANYWATELVDGLKGMDPSAFAPGLLEPAMIDPNSGPWKIMCVLTDYTPGMPVLTVETVGAAPGDKISLGGRLYGMNQESYTGSLELTDGATVLAHGQFSLDPNGNFGTGTYADSAVLTLPATLTPGEYKVTATFGTYTSSASLTVAAGA